MILVNREWSCTYHLCCTYARHWISTNPNNWFTKFGWIFLEKVWKQIWNQEHEIQYALTLACCTLQNQIWPDPEVNFSYRVILFNYQKIYHTRRKIYHKAGPWKSIQLYSIEENTHKCQKFFSFQHKSKKSSKIDNSLIAITAKKIGQL